MLEKIAGGASTAEVAATFGLSVHTVRTHLKNIRRKLEARTQAQAVAIACAEGWISPDVSRARDERVSG